MVQISCRQDSVSLTPSPVNRQDKLSMSSPLLAATLSTCANLSSLVQVHLLETFSLYNKAVTSICCLSQQSWRDDLELGGHPAHRQLDPINSMPRLFSSSSFEEKHFVKQNSNRPPKLLLNNT